MVHRSRNKTSNSNAVFLKTLLLGFAVILAWQSLFIPSSVEISSKYHDQITTGLYHENFRRFFYFYYHLGLFPVASSTTPSVDTPAAAKELIAREGTTLVNEIDWTIRSGERGKVLLFYPGAWLSGGAVSASARVFNILFFISSLLALWTAFVWIKRPGLGAFTIAVFGSNPFQLNEVYRVVNIFGLPISISLWLLAGSLPLIFSRYRSAPVLPPWYSWVFAFFSAALLGTMNLIRPEPLTLVLSPLAVLLVCSPAKPWIRVLMVLFTMVSFLGVKKGWNFYFDQKERAAVKLVTESGGYPFPSFHYKEHRFWHPMYLGLADFDNKVGIQYDDLYGYSVGAQGIDGKLPKFSHKTLMWAGDRYHDVKRHYRVKWEDMPEYNALMKKLYLDKLWNEPVWLLGILTDRAMRILYETTPLSMQLSSFAVQIPWSGLLWLLILGVAVWRRRGRDILLLSVLLPGSLSMFLVYSGEGRCYYSIFHLAAAIVLFDWLTEWFFVRLRTWVASANFKLMMRHATHATVTQSRK